MIPSAGPGKQLITSIADVYYNVCCGAQIGRPHETFAVFFFFPIGACAADFILTIFGTCVNIYNGVTLLVDETKKRRLSQEMNCTFLCIYSPNSLDPRRASIIVHAGWYQ